MYPPPFVIAPSSTSVPLLSQVAQELVKTLKNENLSSSVLDIKLFRVGILIEVVGDLPIDKYTRDMGRKFQDVAMKLPSRTPANAHLTVQAVLRKPVSKVISIATYNNYIKDISSVFSSLSYPRRAAIYQSAFTPLSSFLFSAPR